MALKLRSKYIGLIDFFYFKLFICPRMYEGQNLSLREPTLRLRYESVPELTASWEPQLHFTTFVNLILVQNTDISKTAWINSWLLTHIRKSSVPRIADFTTVSNLQGTTVKILLALSYPYKSFYILQRCLCSLATSSYRDNYGNT